MKATTTPKGAASEAALAADSDHSALGTVLSGLRRGAVAIGEHIETIPTEQLEVPPAITVELLEETDRDVAWMKSALDETWVDDDDEAASLRRAQKWADRDRAHRQLTEYDGTNYLDVMLQRMKNRTFWTDSGSTLWVDPMTSVYDLMYDEMEGSRLMAWKKLVASSTRERSSGRMVEKMESAWTNIGRFVAQTGFGFVKGLSQGLAGLAGRVPSNSLDRSSPV